MARGQIPIEGRDGELAALRSAMRSGAGHGRLVVVRGESGIGKTRLLKAAERHWRTRGVRVANVHAGSSDHYGVDAVISALREDFDRFGDAGLIDGISALSRLHAREPREPGTRFPAVAAQLNWVFGRIGAFGPAAVLIDDVLEIADPVPLLLAARRPGCLVVASVRADADPAQADLLDMADEVLDLAPLADEDIETIAALDPRGHEALRTALGPLYGNPGTVLATLRSLRKQGRLVADGDQLVLGEPGRSIALPADHDLVRRARHLGDLAPRLLAAAATFGALDVDDLALVAGILGEDLAGCERIVDRLVENGLLVGDLWGPLRCACPALAAAAAFAERDTVRLLAGAPVTRQAEPVSFLAEQRKSPMPQSWSATEYRIVELIGLGLTNRQIGADLGMSEKTVERRLTRLFAKAGCRSRVELVAAAGAGVRGRAAA